METMAKDASNGSVAAGARIASEQELSAMLQVATRHDNAKRDHDYSALMATFGPAAFVEIKPAGFRLVTLEIISEMYRRTLPRQSHSFLERRMLREWSNQSGIVREWAYPITLPSGAQKFTKQLEAFEFCDGLKAISSYRVRMNHLYSNMFVKSLGEDFALLPGVNRVPG